MDFEIKFGIESDRFLISNLRSSRVDFDLKFEVDQQLFESQLPPRMGQIWAGLARFWYLNDIEIGTKISYDSIGLVSNWHRFDTKFGIESDRFLNQICFHKVANFRPFGLELPF